MLFSTNFTLNVLVFANKYNDQLNSAFQYALVIYLTTELGFFVLFSLFMLYLADVRFDDSKKGRGGQF